MMAIKRIMVETLVEWEPDYITFVKVSEDEWGIGHYFTLKSYRPMYLIDDSIVLHPFAYENALKPTLQNINRFGYRTFSDAYDAAKAEIAKIML